jgi:heme exporter protein C
MRIIQRNWWKILCLMLLVYAVFAGLLGSIPDLPIVQQTIRNLYFHVGMWFSMMAILGVSVYYSIRYLRSFKLDDDRKAKDAVVVGLVLGSLGIFTGMIWAKNTWGAYWIQDPKLNGAAVSMLAYIAYMVLRSSLNAPDSKARLAAVYNILAFVILLVFIMVIPRMAESSIHPGIDGNPALASGDLDNRMRWVFFPAMLGWILMAVWIWKVLVSITALEEKISNYLEDTE